LMMNLPPFIYLRGPPSLAVAPLHLPPQDRPHLHGRRPLKFFLLLVPPPNQSSPNLDQVEIR
jgi:hypothetical protein